MTEVQHLFNFLQQLLKDDIDFKEDMDFIRDGYDAKMDELRKIAYHSDELLLQYQQELVQKTGVNNVKLKFVMNQGYFIGITNKDILQFETKLTEEIEKIDEDDLKKYKLMRRNTLKGEQRYVSEYLDSIQGQILAAKDELIKMEFGLLDEAKQKIGAITKSLLGFADKVSWLDVFTAYALFAQEKKYIKPIFTRDTSLHIVGGRHPVIEEYLPRDQQFIPNDLALNEELRIKGEEESGFLHIIT